jgi:tetratricopeptide (TPR) repeat protein
LANVLVERGRIKAESAARPSKSADERKRLMAEARKHYEEAQKVFVAAEQRVYERAKALEEEAKTDSKKVGERDETRRDLLQARLYLAGVVYEIGKTHAPGSKEFKENLTEAAKKYQALYEKYGDYTAGLYARMQEGRTYKDLGQNDKAISVLREMLTVPGGDATARMLRNESLGLLVETYLSPKVKKYTDALAQVDKWQETARGAEESSPEGLKIRFLAGQAALSLAEGLKEGDPKRKDQLKAARQHFEFVARFRGDYQREARNMLGFAATTSERPGTCSPMSFWAPESRSANRRPLPRPRTRAISPGQRWLSPMGICSKPRQRRKRRSLRQRWTRPEKKRWTTTAWR